MKTKAKPAAKAAPLIDTDAARKARQREAYRRSKGVQPRSIDLASVARYARLRSFHTVDGYVSRRSYSIEDLAMGLDYSSTGLRMWIRDGRFPPPRHIALKAQFPVYLEDEVAALAGVLKEHLATYKYLRGSDSAVIKKLQACLIKPDKQPRKSSAR